MRLLNSIFSIILIAIIAIGISQAMTNDNTGSISGTVHPAAARATIEANLDGDLIGSTEADPETGDFSIDGLIPGNYEIVISTDVGDYSEMTLDDVRIHAGEDHDLGDIHLEQDDGWPFD